MIYFKRKKLGYVKFDYPTLKTHPSKEKGEEKPKFIKDKKRFKKAFWVDSTSNSFETEAKEETTNLCLMVDNHLGQTDQEEVCELT
ncbi:hypothetical protein MA16_Dca001264 [Dendrobium catenatum]|uniref:Uncharacterized protein n=1 Tax=Dendrobium catenatum TaxID=906689 RepID=A0A2I0WLW9_9ASPA|nr:hypothetical protein MA16_Dca001264 [Dendrobium catenatum]